MKSVEPIDPPADMVASATGAAEIDRVEARLEVAIEHAVGDEVLAMYDVLHGRNISGKVNDLTDGLLLGINQNRAHRSLPLQYRDHTDAIEHRDFCAQPVDLGVICRALRLTLNACARKAPLGSILTSTGSGGGGTPGSNFNTAANMMSG
jgi:hypothetical protein